MNPYAELDVPPDADQAAIRRAYRHRAQATHPDHGGDAAAFQRAKRASLVLLDPARRAKFDATGTIDEEVPDNALSDALVAISQVLDVALVQCAQQGRDPATVDLVGQMRAVAAEGKATIRKQKVEVAAHMANSEKLRGRFVLRKGKEGGNAIAALLDQRIAAQRATIAKLDHEAAKLDRVMAMLADYSFERDATPMQIAPGGWFRMTGT